MKTTNTRSKALAIFFIATLFLQSCVAYQKNPVSLKEASQSQKKVKVSTLSDGTFRFDRIVSEGDRFYGETRKKGELVRMEIQEYPNSKVFLWSKSKSTWETISLIAVAVTGAIVLRSTVSFNAGGIFDE